MRYAFFCIVAVFLSLTVPKLGWTQPTPSPLLSPVVQAPIANEVCFSPDEPCEVKLVEFIKSAKVSIDVAVYDITLEQVALGLILQSKKIPVRILVDKNQAKGAYSFVPKLIKAGVKVKIGHQKQFMHNKFTIIDGQMLETGSFNFTTGAASKNNENQVYLSTPSILERYKSRFESIWHVATSPSK